MIRHQFKKPEDNVLDLAQSIDSPVVILPLFHESDTYE